MHVPRMLIAVALVGSAFAFGPLAARADLIVNSWGQRVAASDGDITGFDSVLDVTVSNVFSETRTATQGGSSSTTIYGFSWDTGGGSFDWGFDHQRAGARLSFAQSRGDSLGFTVTGQDMLYDLSGAYSLTGGQRIFGQVLLRDVTTGATVFEWRQLSDFSPNESFVVGQGGADSVDTVFGSTSGTLLAGHEFDLSYEFSIIALPTADSGATADGDLHFNIVFEVDCNGNGNPDESDISSGASSDCNANSIPDECDIASGSSLDCNGNASPDECEPDADGDGPIDGCDNCPQVANADQANTDGDELGDVCDPCTDVDNDGWGLDVGNGIDCVNGTDPDCDDLGTNASDPDVDNVCDPNDNCPATANPQQVDIDGDGPGDLCDICPAEALDECNPDGSAAEEIPADDGGTVQSPDGNLTIVIPPGSLPADATVSATEIETLPNDPPVDVKLTLGNGIGQVIAEYDFQPDGLVFDPPATVTVCADVTGLNQNQRDRINVYVFDPIEDKFVAFDPPACTVVEDPADNSFRACCTIQIGHFSNYSFIAPQDSDADGVFDDFDGILDNCPNDANPDQDSISSPAESELIGDLVSTKNRFLSFSTSDPGRSQAVRIIFDSLPPPFDVWNGSELWVGPASLVSESGASIAATEGFQNFTAARLRCVPHYTDWSSFGTVHVFHEGIVPEGIYRVDVVDELCNADISTSFSTALPMTTAIWGDTVLDLSQTPPLPPNGPPVDVVDALGVLGRFSSVPTSIVKARADLEPACVDLMISVTDVLSSLSGFLGLRYPFTPTATDPCDSTCPNVLP